MAFSNHFIHHHLREDGKPEDYAHIMIRILRSLKIAGSLYYAPGLPFIEDLLPTATFNVHKRFFEVAENHYVGLYPMDMSDVFYSTRVFRIA